MFRGGLENTAHRSRSVNEATIVRLCRMGWCGLSMERRAAMSQGSGCLARSDFERVSQFGACREKTMLPIDRQVRGWCEGFASS